MELHTQDAEIVPSQIFGINISKISLIIKRRIK